MSQNFVLVFVISFLFMTCQPKDPAEAISSNIAAYKTKIDAYIKRIQERYQIPGIAAAVVKEGEVVYEEYLGLASLEHQAPIHDRSIFRVYSLTKLFVVISVFQLVEQGQLNLSDQISKYVPNLPEAWNEIQIKHLLSHSSGLPDMAPIPEFKDLTEEEAKEKVFSQELLFATGDRFNYNQTNFWLLTKIIERLSSSALTEFVIDNQFEMPIDTIFFSSDSRDIVLHRVSPYFPFSKGTISLDHSYLQGDYGYAMNGLNLTLEEFLNWDRSLTTHQLIQEATSKQMWNVFDYEETNDLFTFGWDKHELNGHASYGFSGSMVTAYRTFPEDQMSIIFLSNGFNTWFDIEFAINHIAHLVDEDVYDPEEVTFETLIQSILANDIEVFKSTYAQLKKNSAYAKVNYESQINNIGYSLLNLNQLQKAVAVFEFNTQLFPEAWNTYDSFGEALFYSGEKERAILMYHKSIELNPMNENGKEMLKRILAN